MVASEFLDYIKKFNFVQKSGLYDIFDRCTYILSFTVILICSAIVTVKSYVLDPMSCYVATDVSGSNSMSYINNYCWVTGTYTKAVHEHNYDNDAYWESLKPLKIHYYQWVPLVLGLQAAILYLPFVFWEALVYNRMGTNLQFFIDAGKRCSLDYGPSRCDRIKSLVCSINVLLKSRITRKNSTWHNRFSRMEISVCYICLKIVTVIVIIAEFLIIERFLNLSGRYRLLGWSLLTDFLWHGHHWRTNGLFPRMGFCRVPFKLHSTQVVNVLAQCSLSVNMLNEKVFLFLWIWFTVLFAAQLFGVVIWMNRCFVKKRRYRFLVRICEVIGNSGSSNSNENKNDLEISNWQPPNNLVELLDRKLLDVDGCFLLHMIRINCGDLVCNEIVRELIESFKHQYTSRDPMDYLQNNGSTDDDDDYSIRKFDTAFL